MVFTVPPEVAEIALQNKRIVYDIIFRASAETLRTIAADSKHLGAAIGIIALLHTWGQNLHHHPHLHCIVPGGGFDPQHQRWISCRPGFFLPVRVLSRLYRRLFLEQLDQAFLVGVLEFHGSLAEQRCPKRWRQRLELLRQKEWVVYSKPPFAGPEKVFDYLGRYTHRVAISNHRILDVSDGKVTFTWRDYRRSRRKKTMTLTADEFIRRFLLHTLPTGFVRIRYFGFLSNRYRADNLQRARELLQTETPELTSGSQSEDWPALCHRLTGYDPTLCPNCGQGKLILIEKIPRDPRFTRPLVQTDSS